MQLNRKLKDAKLNPMMKLYCFFCKCPICSLQQTFLACSVPYHEMTKWFDNEQKSQFNMTIVTKQQILFNDYFYTTCKTTTSAMGEIRKFHNINEECTFHDYKINDAVQFNVLEALCFVQSKK